MTSEVDAVMRIFLAQINPIIGDIEGNTLKILSTIERARERGGEIVLFPELAVTGYPPEDFLLLDRFVEAAERSLDRIINASHGIAVVVGLPRRASAEKSLYNSAAVISDGELLGFQDKSLLPTYDVFDERRFFEPADESHVWIIQEKKVAVTICEDIWRHGDLVRETAYRHDPIADLETLQPDLLLNLSASPFSLGQLDKRVHACRSVAATLRCPVYLCNQVGGNDSLIFDGRSVIVSENGEWVGCGKAFEEDLFDRGAKTLSLSVEEELYRALVLGVRDYFFKQGFTRACLGLSGGIDSAVVACIAVEALGAENVLGLAMPSRFSSEGSLSDASELAKNLGIAYEEVPIEEPHRVFLKLLEPAFAGKSPDTTEENIQARIRAIILMAYSNKLGYILLSTGNKSELALGYSTLYGDLSGGLAVISDVTKQQVYRLAEWINRETELIPQSTITKPPSAELRPDQKDSDTLPDYSVVDTVLRQYVEERRSPDEIVSSTGYEPEVVDDLVKRIHRNEYKRRQSPPGLRVSEKAFTVGRKFPIVQKWV